MYMNESISNHDKESVTMVAEISTEEEYLDAINDLLSAAEKIENLEGPIEYPGLKSDLYATLKKEAEEFPDYAVDIDILIKSFLTEGIQVYIKGSDVFFCPMSSQASSTDSLLVTSLDAERAEPRLQKVIALADAIKAYHNKEKAKR